MSAFTFPRRIYGSILRFKATLGPRQAFVRLRMNHKPPIACILLVYAANGAENPIVYRAVGIMIEALFFRRSIGLIHLPAFPNCSGTALYLCQPRRRLCLVQKRIGEFALPADAERIQQIGRGQKSCVKAVAVCVNDFCQLCTEFVHPCIRHKPKDQHQHIGTLPFIP